MPKTKRLESFILSQTPLDNVMWNRNAAKGRLGKSDFCEGATRVSDLSEIEQGPRRDQMPTARLEAVDDTHARAPACPPGSS